MAAGTRRYDSLSYEPVAFGFTEPGMIVSFIQTVIDQTDSHVIPTAATFSVYDSSWTLVDVVAATVLESGRCMSQWTPAAPLAVGDYTVRCEYTYSQGDPAQIFTAYKDMLLWVAPQGSNWVGKASSYIGGQSRLISSSDLTGIAKEQVAAGTDATLRYRIELGFLLYIAGDFTKISDRALAQGMKLDLHFTIKPRMATLRRIIADGGQTSPATARMVTL